MKILKKIISLIWWFTALISVSSLLGIVIYVIVQVALNIKKLI